MASRMSNMYGGNNLREQPLTEEQKRIVEEHADLVTRLEEETIRRYGHFERDNPAIDVREGIVRAVMSTAKTYDPQKDESGHSFERAVRSRIPHKIRDLVRNSRHSRETPEDVGLAKPQGYSLELLERVGCDEGVLVIPSASVNERVFESGVGEWIDFLQQTGMFTEKEWAIIHYRLNGLTYCEISKKLGVEESMVDRGMQSIRQKLERRGIDKQWGKREGC